MSIIDDALKKSEGQDGKSGASSARKQNSSKVSLIDQVLEREPKRVRLGKGWRKGFWTLGIFVLTTCLVMGISNAQKGKISGWNFGIQKEKAASVPLKYQTKKEDSIATSSIPTEKFGPAKTKYPDLAVSGIVYGSGKPFAIIENRIVKEGDIVGGAKLTRIYPRKVEFQYGTNKFTLRVGEEEK